MDRELERLKRHMPGLLRVALRGAVAELHFCGNEVRKLKNRINIDCVREHADLFLTPESARSVQRALTAIPRGATVRECPDAADRYASTGERKSEAVSQAIETFIDNRGGPADENEAAFMAKFRAGFVLTSPRAIRWTFSGLLEVIADSGYISGLAKRLDEVCFRSVRDTYAGHSIDILVGRMGAIAVRAAAEVLPLKEECYLAELRLSERRSIDEARAQASKWAADDVADDLAGAAEYVRNIGHDLADPGFAVAMQRCAEGVFRTAEALQASTGANGDCDATRCSEAGNGLLESVWMALPEASRDDHGKLTRRQLREALNAAGLLPRSASHGRAALMSGEER